MRRKVLCSRQKNKESNKVTDKCQLFVYSLTYYYTSIKIAPPQT